MNNLREIYNNIFDNIKKFYHTYIIEGKLYIPITTLFNNPTLDWDQVKENMINRIFSSNQNFGFLLGVMEYPDKITYNGAEYNYIPVYICFSSDNTDSLLRCQMLSPHPTDNGCAPKEISFYLNIITHKYNKSNTQKLSQDINDNFYRECSYKEMSVDIFNHIYQPKFELINNKKTIDEIINKYNMDLVCMGSIFNTDPVNKRLFGLPKINTQNLKKNTPDVYRIYEDQGINYRKVISGSHNPFTK